MRRVSRPKPRKGLCQLVADAPAARVEHYPAPVALVHAQLEEMVARAERAELDGRLLRLVAAQLCGRAVQGEPAPWVAA